MSNRNRLTPRRSDGTPDSGFDHDGNDLNSHSSDPQFRPNNQDGHNESSFHDSMPASAQSSVASSAAHVPDVTKLSDRQDDGSLSGRSMLSSSASFHPIQDVTRLEEELDTDQQSVAGDAFECTKDFEIQERLVGARSDLSQPTNKEQMVVRNRPNHNDTRSTGKTTSSTCGMDSTNEVHMPHLWSSTPVNNLSPTDGSSNHSRASSAHYGVSDTPIMVPRRPPASSLAGQSTCDDESSHFKLHTSSCASTSSNDGRRYLGHDIPLNQAFPQTMDHRFAPTSVLPSQSTRLPAARLRLQDKRVHGLKKDAGMNVPSPIYESSTSSDQQETPVPKQRTVSTRNDVGPRRQGSYQSAKDDRLVRALAKQLKEAVAHIDLVESFMQTTYRKLVAEFEDAKKDLEESKKSIEEEKSHLDQQRRELEEDKRKNNAETLKNRNQQRKTSQLKAAAESEAIEKLKTQLQKSLTDNSATRVKLQSKEKELKETKEQMEKLTQSKETVTRTLNLKTKNYSRDLATKEKEIKDLNERLAIAEKRKPGLQPKKAAPSPKPLTNVSNLPPPEPPLTPRQVHFEDKKNRLHIFNDDDTFSEESGYSDELVLAQVCPGLEKGHCWYYQNQDGSKAVDVFRIRHSDRSCCGALQYQYREMRDTRWVLGNQLEVYHYGRHRLEVSLKPLGVFVYGSYYGLEIHRPNNSITHYSYGDKKLVETLPRRDGKQVYALVFTPGRNRPDVEGNSDRNSCEDEQVIRRGDLNEPIEHIDRNTADNSNIIKWQSHRLNAEIVDYLVVADGNGRCMKMKITFRNGQKISISFNPNENHNWVLIEHITENNDRYACCDMGSRTRARERAGRYINCDTLEKYVSNGN